MCSRGGSRSGVGSDWQVCPIARCPRPGVRFTKAELVDHLAEAHGMERG
jgi:hypothetical protein